MIRTLLIANRGEIALRIIRTARRMGVRTVAVFSEADARAAHVAAADVAVPIGPAPARESYLSIPHIIEAARLSGADAVHPGYGFLSENAGFAEACAEAGLVFVGPPSSAIRAMGSKSAAKALMEAAGVPLVPGYHGADQDPALLAAEAARVGYPVLIKASAGGGGKGMRIVAEPGAFAEALAVARGEAMSAFGDDQVLVERYLTRPRHIEIQVFADASGQTVSLFERDCSIQRRHQKVVEEAPAPGLSPELRARMGEAACAAARAIGYVGAGTVEFIANADAPEQFFFMEMNTRLQVEHPVTEMVTGLDLVEWQLLVASGEKLSSTEPRLQGHAIEVRLYAEDPARDFMPAVGRIHHLRWPRMGRAVRIDSGVREGDAVTVHYDPMLAKLIVHDATREGAVRQLRRALAATELLGVQTNLALLRRIAAHPDFAAGAVDTGSIGRHEATLLAPSEPAPFVALAAAAAHVLARPGTQASGDPHSPWGSTSGWRMNAPGQRTVTLEEGGTAQAVQVQWGAHGPTLALHDETAALRDGRLVIDGAALSPKVIEGGGGITVLHGGEAWTFVEPDTLAPRDGVVEGGDRLVAPMPGRIVVVQAEPGQTVARGTVLVVLEAMKVQMRLTAPRDGVVSAVSAVAGALVEEGAELVGFETSTPSRG